MRLPYVATAALAAAIAMAGCQPTDTTPTASSAGPSASAAQPRHQHKARHALARVHHRKARTSSRGVVLAGGGRVVLPNGRRTPGAVNSSVTQANIRSTICRTGYTSTVRPSSSYTTSLKVQQLDSGYAFRGDRSTRDYEEDHLIALEIGGAPNAARNLWPEPYADSVGARTKDLVENQLHDLVCSGRISLRVAQHAIASNWWLAYQRYGGRAVPDVYFGSYGSTRQVAPAAGTSTTGATARCVDGTLSYSAHRSGTCSHHGGVAQWINPPPS